MTQPVVRFHWQGFDGFDALSLYDMLRFRQDIFIVEQNSAYPDLDGLDPACDHLLAWDTDGRIAGYLRACGPHAGQPAFLGRIAIAPAHRGGGLGRRLVTEGMRHMAGQHPGQPIRIGAQQHLARFYESFGFRTMGAPYDDGGIAHVTMWHGLKG
ncbi:GNAT family N-acetyltransferase [Niveispirillum fermenti]|uniref:GNAT family N-acetyltransferase n=1 Tax=Niveispirillum fermenti TaxID=1233113 RepID=UPI003A8C72E3